MNYTNKSEGETSVQPALSVTMQKLLENVTIFDGLTVDLKNKLQSIKRYDKPCAVKEDEVEKESECIMDDLNKLVDRFRIYNDRLEECLNHLNQIA